MFNLLKLTAQHVNFISDTHKLLPIKANHQS